MKNKKNRFAKVKKGFLPKSGKSKSSFKPLTDIQRANIISGLHGGLTSQNIADDLGVRKMQVAAVKAHLTMGTY